MEFKVVKEEKNPFYDRKEVAAEISSDGATPKRKEVAEHIAKKYGCPEDCVAIVQLKQEYGSKKTAVRARVYASAEAKAKAEPAWRAKRGTKKKAEAKA